MVVQRRPERGSPAARPPAQRTASRLVLTLWYGPMAIGGAMFGLIGERRPFGEGVFAHPMVALFIVVAVALMILRIALARPVPEVIPERPLLIGCFLAIAAFLVANFITARLIALP